MNPVGLLTSRELSDLILDENYLVSAFAKENIKAIPVIWSDEQDWSKYTAIIIRNPWDYFEHQEKFFNTLNEIQIKTKLYNSFSLINWNLDKNYLFELKSKGGKLPPTEKINSKQELLEKITNSPFDQLVIKPLISAGAYLTYLFDKRLIPAEVMSLPVDRFEFMIQPFLPDIQTEGEYSFIYFGGKFSHSIIKRPKTGDFRVQSEHGGSVHPYNPTEKELLLTDFIHSLLPEMPHYARIDLVRYEGELVIMEVELVEPELFFRIRPESADMLVQSIKRTL